MSCAIALFCAAVSWSTSLSVRSSVDTVPASAIPDTGGVVVARPVALQRNMPTRNALTPHGPLPHGPLAFDDTTPRRRAIMLSDWYFRRLTLHRYGSYVMLPLFAGQYVLGRRLLSQKDGVYDGTRRVPIDATLRSNHRAVALGVGSLFAVNTTTGLWNLWEARNDGSTSRRRTMHVLSMLGADAGFVATGLMADRAVNRRPSDARAHRNVALASIGLATVGVALMWF